MSKPTTPRTEPPPPIGPRPGNPAPILPTPNGTKPSKAGLLHRERPVSLDHSRLPLGLGAPMQRRSLLTGHAEHFWRWADGDGVWLRVPSAALGRLPYCTSRAAVEQLLCPTSAGPSAVRRKPARYVGTAADEAARARPLQAGKRRDSRPATTTSAAAAPDGMAGGLRAADERPAPGQGWRGPVATNGRRELIRPGGWAPSASARPLSRVAPSPRPGSFPHGFPAAGHPATD